MRADISEADRYGTPFAKEIPAWVHAETVKDAMNMLQAKGRWNMATGRLKEKLARLMDDELQFAEGKEKELLGRIQLRKGQEIQGQVPALNPCESCHFPR